MSAPDAARVAGGSTTRPGGLALVVDDSRSMRAILTRLLTGLGWATREAADGRAAMDLLATEPCPDVALVDWNMPVMNGLDFVSAVRSDTRLRALPVVMVSSETEVRQISLALDAGADEYIVKPFTADALAAKMALVADRRARS
jgi:two-component system, chemotaxis family, chemotaxis protein CheY